MAQEDYTVTDQDGASHLAELNAIMAAIASNNSGPTAPSVTYAYMWWVDTTSGVLKQRNAANSDWITVAKLSNWAMPSVQSQAATAFTTGGSSTAYTLTPDPAIASLSAGQEFDITFHTAAGTTPTLAISGLTAKNLKYRDSTGAKQAVTSTQVPSGWTSKVLYDGTDYVVREIPPANSSNYLAGQVVQVVSVTKTDTWSTSSTSMTDVTGLSVSITPRKNTNKILAILSIALNSQSTVSAHAQLVRGSTVIGIGDAASSRTRSTITVTGNASYVSGSATANFLDSPATTSATTYKVQAMTGQGGTTAYVNRSQNDVDSADNGRGISTLTLLEIGT